MSVCSIRPLISSNSRSSKAAVAEGDLPEVRVLGLQVRLDLGIVALAQPVIVVDAHVAVLLVAMRALRGAGRRHRLLSLLRA